MCTWGNLMEVKTYGLLREGTLKHLASPKHSEVAYIKFELTPFSIWCRVLCTFRDQAAAGLLSAAAAMGEEIAQIGDPSFEKAPHMGFLSKNKVSFHHCQADWISLRGCWHTTQVSCMYIPVLFLNFKVPMFFSGVKVSFWSQQGRTVSIHSEQTLWEPNHALALLPCTSLKGKEKRAMLLELS